MLLVCVLTDPWHHRRERDILSVEEIQKSAEHKSLLLLVLGNAVADTSFPYIVSYINNTDTHVLLRTSATKALSNYQTEEVRHKTEVNDKMPRITKIFS